MKVSLLFITFIKLTVVLCEILFFKQCQSRRRSNIFGDARFCPILPKFWISLPKFSQICPKFAEICPNLSKVGPNLPKIFSSRIPCIPSSYGTDYRKVYFIASWPESMYNIEDLNAECAFGVVSLYV